MRKARKQEVLDCVNSLAQAHEEIKNALSQKNAVAVQNMLSECQEFAVSLGENIEKFEGEGHITVSYAEEYCELLFHIFEELSTDQYNENKIYKQLRKQLIKIENSVKNDIKVRKEVVFFPYKASMWDSMESVYLAAKADPDCDAYCVPIPYYDVRPDRSLGQMHYEGREYPKDIEVIDWKTYHLEERRPDIVYIHNPYDNSNLVTQVHPDYFSFNLKKYTDCLVYIPYYSTTGGMAESQRLCSAYIYADYIVTQAPLFRDYFDEHIPNQKFLPYGSPKFDKIIHKCQNPPEPPAEWKRKMEGRKVYFYNTSIGGMLGNTESFLQKMKYVFSCFEGRDDVCILWRPHPLLESTFQSMRPMYLQAFYAIRDEYIGKGYGIYDTTPDMTDAIAWSDAYIGDSGSSVLSLFGIVGKPIFVLNNNLHSEPDAESWRGQIMPCFNMWEQDRFSIAQGNKLYVSQPQQHDYHYFCDLNEYAGGWYYFNIYEINGKRYACPGNAQDILVIGEHGVERKVQLDKKIGNEGTAFCGAYKYGDYLVLLPMRYPVIVRYNTKNGEIKYFEEYHDVYSQKDEENAFLIGGNCLADGILYLASPTDRRMVTLDIESGKMQMRELPCNNTRGCIGIREYDGCLWLLPYEGYDIIRWNPTTNEIRHYDVHTDGFRCIRPIYRYACDRRPFNSLCIYDDQVYLTPWWGTQYLKCDVETGKGSAWQLPYPEKEGTEYYFTDAKSGFLLEKPDADGWVKIYSNTNRKLYRLHLTTNEYTEIPIHFDIKELRQHESGFCDESQWLHYCCLENAFNSLPDLLNGTLDGKPHDVEKQRASYGAIAANNDGTCGEKVHRYICSVT